MLKYSDSSIGDRVTIKMGTVITESLVAAEAQLGPYSHLRPLSDVGRKARVGNFVELKKSVLHAGAKASHLTYLGDAEVGENVNVGAGTITCNYDGKHKFKTTIEVRGFYWQQHRFGGTGCHRCRRVCGRRFHYYRGCAPA